MNLKLNLKRAEGAKTPEEIVSNNLATETSPLISSSAGSQDPPVLRIWFNTLLEFKGGEVRIVKSYSTPAKDSDVKRMTKKKTVKPKPKKATQTTIKEEEVY